MISHDLAHPKKNIHDLWREVQSPAPSPTGHPDISYHRLLHCNQERHVDGNGLRVYSVCTPYVYNILYIVYQCLSFYFIITCSKLNV